MRKGGLAVASHETSLVFYSHLISDAERAQLGIFARICVEIDAI